jgi:hypothetical protein
VAALPASRPGNVPGSLRSRRRAWRRRVLIADGIKGGDPEHIVEHPRDPRRDALQESTPALSVAHLLLPCPLGARGETSIAAS